MRTRALSLLLTLSLLSLGACGGSPLSKLKGSIWAGNLEELSVQLDFMSDTMVRISWGKIRGNLDNSQEARYRVTGNIIEISGLMEDLGTLKYSDGKLHCYFKDVGIPYAVETEDHLVLRKVK